jgi:subtilisin family serine protease
MKKVFSKLVSVSLISLLLSNCGTENINVLNDNLQVINQDTYSSEFNAMGKSEKRFSISFKNRLTPDYIKSLENKLNTKFTRVIPQIGVAVAEKINIEQSNSEIESSIRTESTIDEFEQVNLVKLEKVVAEAVNTNDPQARNQYHLDILDLDKAWTKTLGKNNIKVAIVDSGIDLNHPDLRKNLVKGKNIIEPKKQPMDDNGHGTHVAGIIGAVANNGIGVSGVAPNCSIMPVKVLTNGKGSDIDIAEGIVWATDNGADVINISIGIYTNSKPIEKAVKYALSKNVVLVSSAGNDSKNSKIHLPSMIKGVIEVSATDRKDKFASFSNFGQQISVAAPGDKILSTLPTYNTEVTSQVGRKYGLLSGTSMASPIVAGIAALLKSKDKSLSPSEIKKIIESSSIDLGKKGYDPYFGYGRVSAYNALRF